MAILIYLNKVSALSQSQIEQECFVEQSYSIDRDIPFSVKMKGKDVGADRYELTELAPKIFKNIRKIHNIDDYMIKSIFSLLDINELDISISSRKGESFFIKSIHGGRMLIKSITKPEYEILQDFLPDYY